MVTQRSTRVTPPSVIAALLSLTLQLYAQMSTVSLVVDPVARIGSACRFEIRTSGPDTTYHLDVSFGGVSPGITLPGGRTVPLNWPLVFNGAIGAAMPGAFNAFTGVTDAEGRALAMVVIPYNPDLIGRVFHSAVVTLNPESPDGVGAISAALRTKLHAPNDRSPLGTNLSWVTYHSTAQPFVDVFKTAGAWIPQLVAAGGPFNTGAALDLTADGWIASLAPGQAAAQYLCYNLDGRYPGGHYTCLYDGSGTIVFTGAASIVSSQPGRIVVNVNSAAGPICLRLTATLPSNPVRNIRLLMPGTEATHRIHPYNPAFLDVIAPFNVLRFMDWQRTNYATAVNWSDRAAPAYYSQGTQRGVALEHLIQLSNMLDADPWFCMPHTASDAYVTQFATMVRDQLEPARKVYIEHSNEVWNGSFPQSIYSRARGTELNLSTNPVQAGHRYHSQRSVQIFQIWQNVFQGNERLVRVMGAHHANPSSSTNALDWQNAHQSCDALAVAPYFGNGLGSPSAAAATVALGVQGVLDVCTSTSISNSSMTAQQSALCAARGVDLIAYEGGQHLVGVQGAENDTNLTNLFIAANRDWAMRQVTLNDLGRWRSNGGKLFMQFSSPERYSKWGSFGVTEYVGQDLSTAPKYNAMMTFINANPRWW